MTNEPTTIKQPLPDVFTTADVATGNYPNPRTEGYAFGTVGDANDSGRPRPANVDRGNDGPDCSDGPMAAAGDYPGASLDPYANETRNSA